MSLQFQVGRFQSVSTRRQADGARIHRAAHQHAVDTTGHGQRRCADVVVGGTLADAAQPASFAPQGKVDHAVVQRAAPSLTVQHLHLDQGHIRPVGLHALGVLRGGELQLVGFARRLHPVAAAVGACGLQHARLVGHVVEREQVVVAAPSLAHAPAVEQQFHLVSRRDDIDGFHRSCGVVPVTYYISTRSLIVHPAAPHHLMGVEGILGYAHGVGHAAGAVVRLAPVVRVGVGEDNLDATRRHARARAGTLAPVVVPASYHLDGQLVHVTIVVCCRLAAIERTVAFLVEGVAVGVPIVAQSFVAAVFHGPHGVFVRLVDVEHLAAILRLVNVEHLAAAYGTSARRVVSVAYLFHLQHVFAADALVAALVEQYAGIVAVVDDGIPHQRRALLPARALHVLFGIACRHGLYESHAVARLDVLFPWRDVHPSHHVAARLHHQGVGVVAEPCRHGQPHCRPLVRRALGVAVHHQHAVVEPHFALAEARLAETGACGDAVAACRSLLQAGLDGIQVAVAPRPEVQAVHSLRRRHRPRLAGLQRDALAMEACHLAAVGIRHQRLVGEGAWPCVVVSHLRLSMYHSLAGSNVEVSGIDIGSRRTEAGVEGQRLVEPVGQMQEDVLGNAAVVGVEVAVVPLVAAVVLS